MIPLPLSQPTPSLSRIAVQKTHQTLQPDPKTLHSAPCTLHPTPFTLHLTPLTPNPQLQALNPLPLSQATLGQSTRNRKPEAGSCPVGVLRGVQKRSKVKPKSKPKTNNLQKRNRKLSNSKPKTRSLSRWCHRLDSWQRSGSPHPLGTRKSTTDTQWMRLCSTRLLALAHLLYSNWLTATASETRNRKPEAGPCPRGVIGRIPGNARAGLICSAPPTPRSRYSAPPGSATPYTPHPAASRV